VPDLLSAPTARRLLLRTSLATMVLAVVTMLLSTLAVPASAMIPVSATMPAKAGGTTTVSTPSGLRVTVTPVRRLNPAGATVKVTGSGFDMTVGIYVALCVKPKKGRVPTPCLGGINTSGKSASSVWISSNPPAYGANLAIPYKKGGSFSVRLKVPAAVGTIDCHKVACAIVTRADHLNSDNRTQDVIVPVRFAG
jgi:hypothetical protein